MMQWKQHSKGFTLIELMIVVAIVGILAAIAYPAYTDNTRKARRADAQSVLMGLASAMERFYTENNTYTGAGASGNTGAPGIYATEAPIDGSTKYYDLTIHDASNTTFEVRATPKGAQAGDGFISLNSVGVRGWDENNNGSIDAGENTW